LTQPQPTICWPNLVGSYLASNSLSISKILQPPGCASSRVLPHHLALRETAIEIPLKVPPYPPYSQHLNTPKKTQQWQQKHKTPWRAHFFTLFLPWFLCTFTGRHFCRWLLKNGLLFDLSEPAKSLCCMEMSTRFNQDPVAILRLRIAHISKPQVKTIILKELLE
jgi:hypothetical protein